MKAAFYSVAKPLLHHGGYREDQIDRICEAMKIPISAREIFAQNVRETNAMWEASKSQVATAMTEATLKRTWYAIPDGDAVYAPMTGSRPGDPLADLFFSAVMATMIQQINDRAIEKGLLPEVDVQQPLASSVTWVDDLAVIIHSDAESLCERAIHMLAIIIDVTTEFGFELSYGPGKTAAMLCFRGKRARAARIRCETQFKHGLQVLSEHRPMTCVPIVHYYKHLGGFLSKSGSVLQEIRVRGSLAFNRLAPLTKIMRDPRIGQKHKQTLIKTMAFSVMTLHSGGWWDLTEGEFNAWQSAWHKVTGCMYGRLPSGDIQMITHQQRARDTQCPLPMEMLYLQRIRLFTHLLKEADIFMIFAVLRNHEIARDSSWLSALRNALTWMQQQIGGSDALEEVSKIDTYEAWENGRQHVHSLRKAIKAAERAHQLRVRAYCDLYDAEKEQSELLREMQWEKEVVVEEPEGHALFPCSMCDFQATSQAALATHEQRKHNMRAALRLFLEDGVCRICAKQFHTRPRLLVHLHHGQTNCWVKLMRSCAPMSPEQSRKMDDDDRARGVALHQFGMKCIDDERACRPATESELVSQLDWFCPIDADDCDPPTNEELDRWGSFGLLPPGQGGRQRTKRDGSRFEVTNVVEGTQQLEHKLRQNVKAWQPFFDYVPRPLVQDVKYVLILCSGHRRWGDIAYYLHKDSDLIPVSIDTAVSSECGNLYDSKKWIDLIRCRKVVGGHGAPPCESFSLARWMNLGEKGFHSL